MPTDAEASAKSPLSIDDLARLEASIALLKTTSATFGWPGMCWKVEQAEALAACRRHAGRTRDGSPLITARAIHLKVRAGYFRGLGDDVNEHCQARPFGDNLHHSRSAGQPS